MCIRDRAKGMKQPGIHVNDFRGFGLIAGQQDAAVYHLVQELSPIHIYPGNQEKLRKMSIIYDGQVKMAYMFDEKPLSCL